MTTEDASPLMVVVSGGGPVGLTFSLHLAMMMGGKVRIKVYEARWFVDVNGITRWQGEDQGKNRRDQVVTLQDHVIEQMPTYIQKGLFQNIDERVWPTSRNIPIREVEDRLFALIQPYVRSGIVELVPEQLQEQSDCLIKGDFDVLIGTDGSNSFVRRYCNIPMISEGMEYACGVAYNIPSQVSPADEPLHQALNCILTVSQTRYLVNSSTSRRGYLNIRLIKSEYDELRERLQEFQNRNEPLDLLDFNKCPQSPVWTIVRQGLDFFKIAPKFVFRVLPIEINVRHASIVVRELRLEVKSEVTSPKSPSLTDNSMSKQKKYKTALAFLAGDAALNVHFWPGRGMNSGMKAAMSIARNIVRSCTAKAAPYSIVVRTPLRFLDFLDYEGFMARLRAREQQGRSLRVLVDPIDSSVEASYSYAHLSHCYVRYTRILVEKLKETRQRLSERPEWPHQTRPITDEELQAAANRISAQAVAQLSLANPWPTREMSGVDVLVEETFPFNLENFLPVPTSLKKYLSRAPSILIPQRFVSLWVVGEPMSESMTKLIDVVKNLPNFVRPTPANFHGSRNDSLAQIAVVHTIEQAKEWITANRETIRRSGNTFKIVTIWSVTRKLTAVDVIRGVRADEPHVPVLIFTNAREETMPALEFPNVTATDSVFDLYEFIGANQETQWNAGCRVKHLMNDTIPEEPLKSPTSTTDNGIQSPCPSPVKPFGLGLTSELAVSGEHAKRFPPPPRSSTSSQDSPLVDTPTLLWIDIEQNDSKATDQLHQAYPQLVIKFTPTINEARSFLNSNLQNIQQLSKFLTICRGQYVSDVASLFEEIRLTTPVGIYTRSRAALKQQVPNIPDRFEIFDKRHELIAFVRTHLGK